MGRGRGKGKKQTILAAREDGSGEEEKLAPVKRRGRPTKALKDEIEEEEEVEKIEGEDDDTKSSISKKDGKDQAAMENGRKRKRPSQAKENSESVEKNGVGPKANGNDSIKPVGFRQNGSRRKNKPRRAAEVGVECK